MKCSKKENIKIKNRVSGRIAQESALSHIKPQRSIYLNGGLLNNPYWVDSHIILSQNQKWNPFTLQC